MKPITAFGSADGADDADSQKLGQDVPCACKVRFWPGSDLGIAAFYLRNRRHLRIDQQPIPE